MSSPSEYESSARQDYGPATSSESEYELTVAEPKVTDKMSVPSVRPPVLRALPLSPSEGDPEPDSTNPESIIQSVHNKVDKEIEYHITDKRCETEMSVDSLAGLVRIEETSIDNLGRISYPILQEADDSEDGNYVENSATLIQAPLNTAIVQNVKLPQNFTINVDGAVSNITAIQNVSQDVSGSQTLWLPTILATSATSDSQLDDDRSQAGVSQIIITGESYVNEAPQSGRRPNIITDTSYISRQKGSKVQILSNISLPKSNFSQQYLTPTKEITNSVYATQNHVYKINTSSVPQKHLNNSVLCSKASKNQSLIGCAALSSNVISSPIKSVSYSHTITKNSNMSKTPNKINNGANLNAMVAASAANTQCHILSRVVSGPNKMSVQSGRKSANSLKGSKNSTQLSGAQKNQSRSIKIIQQSGSVNKSEGKSWPTSMSTYKQTSYSVVDTNASNVIQKVGSPPHKSQQMALQKVAKGERLVLQSPCGPVLVSTAPISTSLPKGPHYVQSGSTPNLRYVQTYGNADHQMSTISQVSANQQLTAQILQSLSQPKLMLQPNPSPIKHPIPPMVQQAPSPSIIEEPVEMKPYNHRRIVFGDKSTLLTADDIIGMEERPNLSEEIRRYTFQALAFVMLDHTYAQSAQKEEASASPPTSASAPASAPPPAAPCAVSAPPASPARRSEPAIAPPVHEPPAAAPAAPPPAATIQLGTIGALSFGAGAAPADDDAASTISSPDGARAGDAGGSDTETAPEGEDEGKTRCICDFAHDDGYMICCDRCGEWQHVDCMGIDRQNIPEAYMCALCLPRAVDRRHARAIQLRKREELSALGGSDSDSSAGARVRPRLLTVTTYSDTRLPCAAPRPPPPPPPPAAPRRGPKKPRKADVQLRKGPKRKLSEKRVKRKKELMMSRNKYNSSLSNSSHWQDSFEQAVTNHYSPELRAKIMKYSSKLGNTPNLASAITAHLCTTVPHAGGKILIATKDLKDNTPIIELRGKYMLSNQHRPQLQSTARAGSQKPGPFVFFYRLPKDNTQICIDTRTYGNEARFVRRSCKPNAELQHCIVKGALHVYLVTLGLVQSNTEITVGHDSNGSKQPCACGNPKHCKVNGLNPMGPRKSVDYPPREKRSRNRGLSMSSPPPPLTPTTPIKDIQMNLFIKSEKKSPIKSEFSPMSPVKNAIMALKFDEPIKTETKEEEPLEDEIIKEEIDLLAKEEMKLEIDEPDFSKPEPLSIKPVVEEKPVVPELVPEPEVKNEPEPPVVEAKMEEPKPVVPKIEEQVPLEDIKVPEEPDNTFSDEEKFEKEEEIKKPKVEKDDERPFTRSEVTARSACHDRSSRSSRTTCVNQDSLDDKTDDSQDKPQSAKEKERQDKRKMTREERKMEAIMKAFERMEKAEQRKQEVKERQKRRESDPHPNVLDKEEEEDLQCVTKKRRRRKGRARTTSQSTRRRLNSADSDMVTSGDEAPPPRTPPRAMPLLRRNSTINSSIAHDERSNNEVREDLGLSSACLLVEAAVGSVESAFKLPKTKKTMANEWLGRSPERTPSPYQSPYRPALVNAPSLESLVRVASTMIGDLSASHELEHEDEARASPPRTPGRERSRPPKKARRVTRHTPPAQVAEVVQVTLPQHSAKKRWLRQAISEESDSPSADVFVPESPPNEMVTPLKKRRLARESLSCEQNPIVPCNDETSPVLTSEDSPVKDDPINHRQYKIRNIMESIYSSSRDRTRSDSGQGSDDQCNMDNDVLNVNLKVPHDSENIRRIIGVPTPDEELSPELAKPEDKTNNNNVDIHDTDYNKVVPMEIDTTIPAQPKLQESSENSNSDLKLGSPVEKLNSCQSADTSGNSSPQRDEMDDIQKKIHSFHTENILMLKSRNKKPKEKRKKVNLNFDLNMVDDQISVQLRPDNDGSDSPEVNGDHADDSKMLVSPENIPLPPVDTIPVPAPENIPLPEEPSPLPVLPSPPPVLSSPPPVLPPPEAIPLPEEPLRPARPASPREPPADTPKPEEKPFSDRPSVLDSAPFTPRFSTGLFSEIFNNMSQSYIDNPINENVPNMSIIKSAIDRTTSIDSGLFDKDNSAVDELKNVQEILTRVNSMDSNNSVILSGVLSSSNKVSLLSPTPSPKPATKPYFPRSNDPRLNPPPVEKPKPVRRKLSITEYRKRYKGPAGADSSSPAAEGADAGPEWSSESSGAGSMSPQRLDAAAAAAADDLEQRLHRELAATHLPKGVFDAQPTASERQRENLSSRLRREFGLALPEDEEARAAPAAPAQHWGGPSQR